MLQHNMYNKIFRTQSLQVPKKKFYLLQFDLSTVVHSGSLGSSPRNESAESVDTLPGDLGAGGLCNNNINSKFMSKPK